MKIETKVKKFKGSSNLRLKLLCSLLSSIPIEITDIRKSSNI